MKSGRTAEQVKESHEKAIINSKNQDRKVNTKIEWWLYRGYTEEEAEKKLSERQSTFSLDKCIEKHGEDKGREVWAARQEKWLNSFPRLNYSLISQELFWQLEERCNGNFKFATKTPDGEKTEFKSKENFEHRLNLTEMVIVPDFIDMEQKKIIEFDGEYWHKQSSKANPARERKRDKILLNNGYDVLRISETEYKDNKEETIQKCIQFLKQ